MTENEFSPFLVTLTIGSAYIQPKKPPTLDALLLGALRLVFPYSEDVSALIPLQKTDGVFHGSCMICDPLFSGYYVKFFQSINNERKEQTINGDWLDTRIYKGLDVDVSKLRKGDSGRGAFSTKMDDYTLYHRGSFWKAGFFGCGDLSQVKSLLHKLPGIGRKAARGYGAIFDVDVDPVDTDYSLIRDGKPMRPIPENLWVRMGGSPLPLRMARAEIHIGNPDEHEVLCVAPTGEHLSW